MYSVHVKGVMTLQYCFGAKIWNFCLLCLIYIIPLHALSSHNLDSVTCQLHEEDVFIGFPQCYQQLHLASLLSTTQIFLLFSGHSFLAGTNWPKQRQALGLNKPPFLIASWQCFHEIKSCISSFLSNGLLVLFLCFGVGKYTWDISG